uniref:Uncharacterized protein n=1 Tax=Vitrella brassicaformis TaxID=1169539 RepID=A0A7S1K8Q9_9ALVE|mmetsp:Transcript_4328/g.9880  ORF Transcript_4328/g.9880 Transcript_4328/m.9880 type:complete len:101 (+) Transcript_4328:237-539(+)
MAPWTKTTAEGRVQSYLNSQATFADSLSAVIAEVGDDDLIKEFVTKKSPDMTYWSKVETAKSRKGGGQKRRRLLLMGSFLCRMYWSMPRKHNAINRHPSR